MVSSSSLNSSSHNLLHQHCITITPQSIIAASSAPQLHATQRIIKEGVANGPTNSVAMK
jgi:hypothetical protein